MTFRDAASLFRQAWRSAGRDHAPFLAAGLSFFMVFSVVPVALVVVAIAGAVWSGAAASGELVRSAGQIVGEEPARILARVLGSAQKPGGAGLASVAVLFGASAFFYHLQNALNFMWGLDPRRGVRGAVTRRLLAFAMVLIVGILMLASFLVHAGLSAARGFWGPLLPAVGHVWVWRLLNNAGSLVALSALFAAIYKLLPSIKLRWSDVWVGGAVTSLLVSAASHLAGLYFGVAHYRSLYGAGATILVVLLWMYISAQVFLLGAEFTWAYAKKFGSMANVPAGPDREKDHGQKD